MDGYAEEFVELRVDDGPSSGGGECQVTDI